MATLIFDIETVGTEWESLPGGIQDSLMRQVHTAAPQEDKIAQLRQVTSRLALSPFTARIVSLAMYDVERKLSAVYYLVDGEDVGVAAEADTVKVRTEAELLEDFWESARSYNTFVTFNGRSFALPFLYHRSALLGIKPTTDIARERYVTKQHLPYHVDLLDEFSFYGAMRRPSLQLLATAYRVPFINSGIKATDVDKLFLDKKFSDIATRNVNDVASITALFEVWKTNFAPASFLNACL